MLVTFSITAPRGYQKLLAALALLCSPFIVALFLVAILTGSFVVLGGAFSAVLFLGVHSPVGFLVALVSLGVPVVFKGNCYATL